MVEDIFHQAAEGLFLDCDVWIETHSAKSISCPLDYRQFFAVLALAATDEYAGSKTHDQDPASVTGCLNLRDVVPDSSTFP